MSKQRHMSFIPLETRVMKGKFDLFKVLKKALKENSVELQDGDVLVISSKFASVSEGRVVRLMNVKVSPKGKRLGKRLKLSKRMAELVLRESDQIFGGIYGYILTAKHGTLTPNAGIDRSNIYSGWVVLYPRNPNRTAEELRKKLLIYEGKHVGIVIADSRLMPLRLGTVGVALGVAGFEPVKDERGRRDLFGNILKVTSRALADSIASAAQILMGEADEAIPIVLARGTGVELRDVILKGDETSIPYDQCIYVRGLSRRRL